MLEYTLLKIDEILKTEQNTFVLLLIKRQTILFGTSGRTYGDTKV